MKVKISGIIQNSSTNPFQTFSRGKPAQNSKLLSFDISFDLCDEEGNLTRVFFNRSFRFPPPIEDGDYVEVVGRFGQFFGLIGKSNFYATKIIDKKRNKMYTTLRNIDLSGSPARFSGAL